MLESILSPVILGPATLIRSSSALRWQSLLLEKYSCSPGERPEEKPLDQPVLVMLCSPTWRGEKRAADGTFVPTSKTVGALTTVPRGPVPFGRSFEKADILYCAFGDPLLSAAREELDGRLPLPTSPRSGLHDHAVSGPRHWPSARRGSRPGTRQSSSVRCCRRAERSRRPETARARPQRQLRTRRRALARTRTPTKPKGPRRLARRRCSIGRSYPRGALRGPGAVVERSEGTPAPASTRTIQPPPGFPPLARTSVPGRSEIALLPSGLPIADSASNSPILCLPRTSGRRSNRRRSRSGDWTGTRARWLTTPFRAQ